MRKITSLLTLFLLCIGGAWATDVTVIDKSQNATTYGSLSGGIFTTNAASGLAGLTVSGIKGTTATSFAYGACLALTSTQNGTITITAPDGYNITGYSLTARSNTYSVPYTLTPAAGGSAVTTSTTGVSLTTTGLSSQSASFTYSAASANSFYIPALTVTVVSASAQLVNVTYNLYDVGDMVNIKATEVKTQEANSAINIPSSFLNTTYFDYTTSGTIGDVDCTISVVRTPKNGVVYPLSNLSNSKAYTLTTARGTLGTSGTQMVSTNGTSFAASNFAIISYEGNYYLWSVADSKWVSANSQPTLTSNVGEAGVVNLTETNAPYYFMGMGALGVNMASGYYTTDTHVFSGIVVNNYTTSDPGNQYVITEAADFDPTAALQALDDYFHPSYYVTYVVKDTDNNILYTSDPVGTTLGANITTLPVEYQRSTFYTYDEKDVTISETNTTVEYTATLKADAPFKFTADTTNPYYYNLKIRGKFIIRQSDNTVRNQDSSEPFNPDAAWAFIGKPYDGFRVINQAAGTNYFLMYDEIRTGKHAVECVILRENDTRTWNADNNSTGFVLRASENPDVYLHQRTVNGLSTCSLSEWAYVHDDAGSTIVVSTDEQALFDLYNALNSIAVGEGPNKYSVTGMTTSEFQTEMANIGDVISNQSTSEYATAYNTLLGLQTAFTLNLPAPGFYRIKGNTSGKYLVAGFASNNKFAMTDATDETTVFYFDGSKLVNYSTGMSNGMNKNDWAWATSESASVVTFLDGLTNGGYVIKSASDAYGTLTAYLYDNGDGSNSADRGSNLTINSNTNARYTSWYLEPVTALDLTLTDLSYYNASGCYTTMFMPVNVQVTGATVYAVTGATGNSLNVEELTDGVVPANTGVILEGTTTSATATVCATASTVTSVLNGSVGATDIVPTNSYVLSVANDKLGFYKFAGSQFKGFRAYYLSTSADPTRGFVLNFGETTGVGFVVLGNNGNAYDLQGRRVNNAQKGVFIINGKKVVK